MTELRLHIHQARPDYCDLFEAELAKHNLTMRVSESSGDSDVIILLIDTKNSHEEQLVQELATLCFAHAYKA